MADLVENILQSAAEKESKFKSTAVEKDIDVEIDEGNLLCVDPNQLDLKRLKSNKEDFLGELTRDNVQLLFNKIWQLPVERVEDAVLAKLPDPTTRLPREKPIPAEKKLTKWEQYQKDKGFTKRKKDRMVYDEEHEEYRPRWGYKRKDDIKDKWVLEVPDHIDPYEDQFEKLKKDKKERVAKNELQRLRNMARNMKGKMPSVGVVPTPAPTKHHVQKALHEARTSDASLGRFSKDLKNEQPAKNMGKKRKFESNHGSMVSEKRRALDILGKIQGKKAPLNVEQATNKELRMQDMSRSGPIGKGSRKPLKGKAPGDKMGKGKPASKAGGKGKRAPIGKANKHKMGPPKTGGKSSAKYSR